MQCCLLRGLGLAADEPRRPHLLALTPTVSCTAGQLMLPTRASPPAPAEASLPPPAQHVAAHQRRPRALPALMLPSHNAPAAASPTSCSSRLLVSVPCSSCTAQCSAARRSCSTSPWPCGRSTHSSRDGRVLAGCCRDNGSGRGHHMLMLTESTPAQSHLQLHCHILQPHGHVRQQPLRQRQRAAERPLAAALLPQPLALCRLAAMLTAAAAAAAAGDDDAHAADPDGQPRVAIRCCCCCSAAVAAAAGASGRLAAPVAGARSSTPSDAVNGQALQRPLCGTRKCRRQWMVSSSSSSSNCCACVQGTAGPLQVAHLRQRQHEPVRTAAAEPTERQ